MDQVVEYCKGIWKELRKKADSLKTEIKVCKGKLKGIDEERKVLSVEIKNKIKEGKQIKDKISIARYELMQCKYGKRNRRGRPRDQEELAKERIAYENLKSKYMPIQEP